MKPSRLLTLALTMTLALCGCHSPEDGNYTRGAVHVPSKLDGTKTWTSRPKT
jgi:hypothetical protein